MRALLLAALCMLSAPLAAESLTGTYGITGYDPSTGESYRGKAKITGEEDVYQITWSLPIEKKVYIGTGIRQGDTVSFVFLDQRAPESPGVLVYKIDDDTLSGKWVLLGRTRKGSETLKRLD